MIFTFTRPDSNPGYNNKLNFLINVIQYIVRLKFSFSACSPENVVEKRNILSLFKLAVAL